MSPTERRALLTVLLLGLGGHLIRAADRPGDAPGAAVASLLDPSLRGDPLAHRDSSIELARPLGQGERINVDLAGARELERLPGIGPALARRIVADRESLGAFGGIDGLDRVPGIGPAALARLAPHLDFLTGSSEAIAGGVDVRVSLNQATARQLQQLPGIGTARARAIVAFRDSAGPFRHVDDLARVPGIPARVIREILPMARLH